MRNPENVLISLTKHSNQKDYKYERLYRLLYNEELYLTAYQNIYSNDGSMTKGTDKQTVDGMSIERIRKIIVSLKDESYQPKPARRTYIPKKNGKMSLKNDIICIWILTLHAIFLSVFPKMKLILHKMQWCS